MLATETQCEVKERLGSLRHEDPFLAYDEAREAARRWPEEIFFLQVQAQSLIRTGSLQQAQALLEDLYARGHRDAETLGLLGRVWREHAQRASDGTARGALERARQFYIEGLENAERAGTWEGYYPGINAATLSAELDEAASARDFARRAEKLALQSPKRNYWVAATLAEAAAIEGGIERARALYREAQALSPTPEQSARTRRHSRLVAERLLEDAHCFDLCFQVPPVTLFVGHMTDAPGREAERFPERLVQEIASRLRRYVAENGLEIGFSSAARGGDLLFLDALQSRGAETQIILPLEPEAFLAASVAGGAAEWESRYRQCLSHARRVRVANYRSSSADGATLEYANRFLAGLAQLRARELETPLNALVLWNGEPGDGPGGTASAVAHLVNMGLEVENIFPGREGRITDAPASPHDPSTYERRLFAMLFADCRGYSELREEQVGAFTKEFLQTIADLAAAFAARGVKPFVINTWGDGLFMAFENLREAGRFALALRAQVGQTCLNNGLALRIALHAGPALPFTDPITLRPNIAGVNVSFSARIEPITRENQIYVSEPFATLATDWGADDLHFGYLGLTDLHEGYGRQPLYLLSAAKR